MAKYKLPVNIDRFKGSIGGSTFQRSGKVFSIRKRNVPVQKRSVSQSASKNKLASVQSQYKDLTNSQKLNFSSEAGSYPRLNSFNVPYELTSTQLFCSSNINAANSAIDAIINIQGIVSYPAFSFNSIIFDYTLKRFEVELDVSFVPDLFYMYVYASSVVSKGLEEQSLRSMKLINIFPSGEDTGLNLFNNFSKAWGVSSLAIGNAIWVRVTFLSVQTGQFGSNFQILVGITG